MKFGPVPVGEAEGGIAVHSIRQAGLVLKKGTMIGKPEIAALKSAAVQATGRFDHHNINEVEPFIEGGRNPTAEELARFLAEELGRKLDDRRVRICKVEVFETDNNRAEYCP